VDHVTAAAASQVKKWQAQRAKNPALAPKPAEKK
jgi:hypothetical protein